MAMLFVIVRSGVKRWWLPTRRAHWREICCAAAGAAADVDTGTEDTTVANVLIDLALLATHAAAAADSVQAVRTVSDM